jgi:hypothetical protein
MPGVGRICRETYKAIPDGLSAISPSAGADSFERLGFHPVLCPPKSQIEQGVPYTEHPAVPENFGASRLVIEPGVLHANIPAPGDLRAR